MTTNQLSARYEVRRLMPEHVQWACAIQAFNNSFSSKVWPHIYSDNLSKRAYEALEDLAPYVLHQINSGHSLGLFDKEFEYRHNDSASRGGQTLWNPEDINASSDVLLSQMDFPLLSIALAYDGFVPPDPMVTQRVLRSRPLTAAIYHNINSNEQGDTGVGKPDAMGQVLYRGGTYTRADCEGRGFMKVLAHSLMRSAASKGFRMIRQESLSDSVTRVWLNPPSPYTSQLVSEIDLWDIHEENENGQVVFPFRPLHQKAVRILCKLKS